MKTWVTLPLAILAGTALIMPASSAANVSAQEQAAAILRATGVTGGLVIHVGCGNGRLTVALHASDGYLVHGIDTNPRDVRRARRYIMRQGLYGPVAVDVFDGRRLPYIDNLADLVVAEDLGDVSMSEVMRVLAPGGVAYIKRGGKWTKTVKAWPKNIDQWTHYLHDATNNAVAHDEVIGPPRHVQWLGSPRWSRHHDHMASTSAMVTANGRVFYIFDEGPTASVELPSDWKLIARDAFNGVILWKRKIGKWWPQLYPLKSGPTVLTRRLVAVGDRVYVTLALNDPLSCLDAVTGKTLWTCQETRATEEIIWDDGRVFVVVNPADDIGPKYKNIGDIRRYAWTWRWQPKPKRVMALDAATGKVLWRYDSAVAPETLTAADGRVFFHDGDKVVCLDAKTGERLWTSQPLPRAPEIPTWFAPTLVYYKGLLLFAGGDKLGLQQQGDKGSIFGIDAKTGKVMWRAYHPACGYKSPEDVLVAGGLVWAGETTIGSYSGEMYGIDPFTGKVKAHFFPDVKTYWFHHRCYRSKATDKYIMTSRTGIEFIDFRRKHWIINHWVRGGCLYGIMPANGLIYTPPHDCACYLEAKQFGFNALAPASRSRAVPRDVPDEGRLERGPAYGLKIAGREPAADDWPTYRYDNRRFGYTPQRVAPAGLTKAWELELGGKLTSITEADGKLFLAATERHTLYAIDADAGRVLWTYIAGGRIDSPPTYWRGRVYFGCADGWVYCLRASDGELVWRFRAAPVDRRLVAFEQVESVWPVHGSVLIQDNVLYCVAGRSMFLDGGLRLLRLNPETGEKIGEVVMDDKDPKTGENLQKYVNYLDMPVALPDVLSSDGKYVYMRSQPLTMDGKRTRLAIPDVREQRGDDVHLFSPTGFLDASWFHRTYWVWGRVWASGWNKYYLAGRLTPSGRIMVIGPQHVFAFARKTKYYRWTTPLEYHLYRASREIPEAPKGQQPAGASEVSVPKSASLNPAGKPLTIEAWVNAKQGDGVVLARGGPLHGYALFLRRGRPYFAVRVDSKLCQISGEKSVVGRWVHLAGVLTDDHKLLLYVDGKLAASGQAPDFIVADPAQAMEIGADEGGGVGDYNSPFGLKAAIDQVRIYHRALSAEEIRRHAETPETLPQTEPGLVLFYSFDDGKAKDLSGHGNNGKVAGARVVNGRVGKALQFKGVKRSRGIPVAVKFDWSEDVPMLVRAMAGAGDVLFIAGPPDVLDEEKALSNLIDPQVQKALAEQAAAILGQRGGVLWAVSMTDGSKLAEYKFDSPPVFDSLIAPRGRLYMATMDGRVVCLAPQK